MTHLPRLRSLIGDGPAIRFGSKTPEQLVINHEQVERLRLGSAMEVRRHATVATKVAPTIPQVNDWSAATRP